MAEAILFGHRALRPLVDLQEQLREAVGKPKRLPYLEPGDRLRARLRRGQPDATASSSSSTSRRPARTRRWPTSSRSPPSRSRAARSPTAGRRSSNPGRPIVGNQMHGITDKDVKGAPSRAGGGRARRWTSSGDALVVGHNVGFDLGVPRGGAGRRHPDRARPLPRHADRSPARATRTLENYKLDDAVAVLRHRARPRATAPCPDAEATANLLHLVRQRPARRASRRSRRRSPTPSAPTRTGGDPKQAARGGTPRRARQQEPVRAPPQEDRPRARPRRGHPHGRPRRSTRSARSRSRSACSRGRTAPACSPAARRRR